MDQQDKITQVTIICQKLGAPKEQASTMAKQLLKRAEQLSQSQAISEIEALDYLLRLVKSGREGTASPQAPSSKGSRRTEN